MLDEVMPPSTPFSTARLPAHPSATAPDGSAFRPLLRLPAASLAHFTLEAGRVSRAIAHRTVEEIWYVLEGHGEMWRRQGGREEAVAMAPGVCLTVPGGTAFQFRAAGRLSVVVATVPAWPGDDEAVPAKGPWTPTAG